MVSAVRLNALLDDLDRAGLDAGPSARQQAHLLYMLLAADQSLDEPNAERRLIDHLRPLIIRSREQSAAFERVVSLWGVHAQPSSSSDTGKGSTSKSETDQATPRSEASPSFNIAWAAMAGVIGLFIVLFWIMSQGPAPAPTPVTQDGPTGGSIATRDQTRPTPDPIIQDDEAVELEEIVVEQAIELNQGLVEFQLAYHFLQFEFAPTLRELHSTGLFSSLPLSRVGHLTGFQPDQPLAMNEDTIERLFRTVFYSTEQTADFWENLASADLSMEGDGWVISAAERANLRLDLINFDPQEVRRNGLAPLDAQTILRSDIAIQTFTEIEKLTWPFAVASTLNPDIGPSMSANFSTDGAQVAIGKVDGTIEVLDTSTGNQLLEFRAHDGQIWSTDYAPDNRQIVSAGMDGFARLWNAQSGSLLAEFQGHADQVTHATFTHDGERIITSSDDESVRIWSIENASLLQTFEGNALGAWYSDVSADDTRLLTASKDGNVRLWDLETERLLQTWQVQETEANTVTFSNDETRFLTSSPGGAVKISDIETGATLVEFVGHENFASTAFFSPDDTLVVTASGDTSVRIWDAATGREISRIDGHSEAVNWAEFTSDGSRIVSVSNDGTLQIAEKNPSDLFPTSQTKVWTTKALADEVRQALASKYNLELPEYITDADVVRQVAALANHRGETLVLRDPPWQSDALPGLHEPHFVQVNAPILAALTFALIGIGIWLWSAFNMRAYLQRRRPGDPGRVIDLFSDTRHQADKVQNAIRRAAKALLQRQPGHERLDIKASVKATARARGLFTPVEKRDTRMPEYLFLIDARSRADHETQRTLDYLDRLRKEHVPITHYFYERAPDKVRASMGAPAQSLDLIASEHSDKRLVLVGDAASMYSSARSGSGAWKKTLESWQSKSFATTVPVAEWGLEEARFTQETGLVTNVLSAEGLEALPTSLFAEGMVGQVSATPAGALDVPPLPSLLRRDPERWILDASIDDEEWMDLQVALVGYLSVPGWRWLCACAVYPVIEWDLTVALGQVLKGTNDDPLFTESLAARLSELPWMRAGEMPDWFRARLIGEIDDIDREAVRDLIAKILEAVDSEQKSGGDSISLKFGYLQGREPDSDERFVDFVTRAPESMDENALQATRKLRELLRPNLLTRLIDPGALGWLVIGISAAVIAWMIAPRYVGVPTHTAAWAPLFAMLVGPVVAWLVWRGGKKAWATRTESSEAIMQRLVGAPQSFALWIRTMFGFVTGLAGNLKASPQFELDRVASLMRRRVEVWTMALMVVLSGAILSFSLIILGLIWRWFYGLNDGWMTAFRTSLLGEITLSLLLAVALYFIARAIWRGLKWQYNLAVRFTDRAALHRHDLTAQRGGRVSRAAFVIGAVFVTFCIAGVLIVAINSVDSTWPGDNEASSAFMLFEILVMVAIPAWHAWTLRRFARALDQDMQTDAPKAQQLKAAA